MEQDKFMELLAVALSAFSVFAFLIFTPETLVLLRNLTLLAVLTWATVCFYTYWEVFQMTRIVRAFRDGGILAALSMLGVRFWEDRTAQVKTLGDALKQKAISAGAKLLNPFQHLFGIFGCFKTTSETSTGESPSSPPQQQYYAILVTTPPVHEYDFISGSHQTPRDQPERILWNLKTPHVIPPMQAMLAFRRHFALCLIQREEWESTEKTLEEKFKRQLFWDYSGNGILSSEAAPWPVDRVRAINAIQEIGTVSSGDNVVDVCSNFYTQLRRNWDYINIWWNSGDFALTLAYLLINDTGKFSVNENGVSVCRQILDELTKLRLAEDTMPPDRIRSRDGIYYAKGFTWFLVAIAVKGGIFSPFTSTITVYDNGLIVCSRNAAGSAQTSEGANGLIFRMRASAVAEIQTI